MRKQVTIFECDNLCGNTESLEGPIKGLPEGWIELTAIGNKGEYFNQQLCTQCFIAVGNALGARQNEARK